MIYLDFMISEFSDVKYQTNVVTNREERLFYSWAKVVTHNVLPQSFQREN